jgi:hypothetical protein
MIQESKRAKNTDYSVDIGEGVMQHLTFNPSKNFAEGNLVLFGITVRQQGRRLIIITKIYEEERREEIVGKLGIMVKVMMDMTFNDHTGVDRAHIVDQKDILSQISKHKMTADKLAKNVTQEQDVTVETIDLITGEMVPVEFSMKLLKIEKTEMKDKKTNDDNIQK